MTTPTPAQLALIPSDAAVTARAAELGLVKPPPVVVVPAQPVVVNALTIKGADVGNSVPASISLVTAGTVNCTLALAVRADVANAPDVGDDDFTHLTGTVLHGAQTFTFGKAFTTAGPRVTHVAYLVDGTTTWVHLTPSVKFTITTPAAPPVTTNPVPTANPLGTTGARSGLAWNSGIWPPVRNGNVAGNFASTLAYQEGRRGCKSDTDMFAQWSAQWSDLIGAGDGKSGLDALKWLLAGSPAVPILMLPPFPDGGTWTAAAAGQYDANYNLMGQTIAFLAQGRKVVLRFAWECNGNWYAWSIINTGGVGAFKAGWARAVTAIRAGAGASAKNIIFDYSLSNLDDKGQGDPLTNAPDVAFWDVLGIDAYDDFQVTTSPTVPGKIDVLNRAAAYVVANKKWISLDEWGLDHAVHTDGRAQGNDNPNYIDAMYGWMKTNRSILAWESYFQDDGMNNVNSSLFSPNVDNNPNSRAAYLFLQAASR